MLAGLLAGLAGRQAFAGLWGLIDDEEPPEPGHRDVSWGKVLAATILQAAVFAAARTAADRWARKAFEGLTGRWPGEKAPDPE